jgi:hypothetical protein
VLEIPILNLQWALATLQDANINIPHPPASSDEGPSLHIAYSCDTTLQLSNLSLQKQTPVECPIPGQQGKQTPPPSSAPAQHFQSHGQIYLSCQNEYTLHQLQNPEFKLPHDQNSSEAPPATGLNQAFSPPNGHLPEDYNISATPPAQPQGDTPAASKEFHSSADPVDQAPVPSALLQALEPYELLDQADILRGFFTPYDILGISVPSSDSPDHDQDQGSIKQQQQQQHEAWQEQQQLNDTPRLDQQDQPLAQQNGGQTQQQQQQHEAWQEQQQQLIAPQLETQDPQQAWQDRGRTQQQQQKEEEEKEDDQQGDVQVRDRPYPPAAGDLPGAAPMTLFLVPLILEAPSEALESNSAAGGALGKDKQLPNIAAEDGDSQHQADEEQQQHGISKDVLQCKNEVGQHGLKGLHLSWQAWLGRACLCAWLLVLQLIAGQVASVLNGGSTRCIPSSLKT